MEINPPGRWLDSSLGNIDDLYKKINEQEHQQQDFKFRIDSTQKIAKTLAAFANTDGGILLIGVKDNGKISGCDPEEEFYMIDGASNLHCSPPVEFTTLLYITDEEKKVLQITVPSSRNKPHSCLNQHEKWRVYIRQADENFEGNRVISNYLKSKTPNSKRKNLISYGPEERMLFDYLSENKHITLSKFSRISQLNIDNAEAILIAFLQWKIIGFEAHSKGIRFFLIEE